MKRSNITPPRKKLQDIMQVPGARTRETERKISPDPARPGFTFTTELKFYMVTGVLGLVVFTIYLFAEALG